MLKLPFVKLYPSVIKKTNSLSAAAIFGRMHGYASMTERWICFASKDKIANELGLSYNTVLRGIKILESAGYIKDLTPDTKNVPHRYKVNVAFIESVNITEVATKSYPDDKDYLPDDEYLEVDTMGMSPDEMMEV